MNLVFRILVLFLLNPLEGFAQFYMQGKVLALPNREPVAFANIGIINASIGTISDHDGSFSMSIPRVHSRDSIIFSALGYEKVSIPVSKLQAGTSLTIYLKETSYRLSVITITAERSKPKYFSAGNAESEGGSLYADTVNAGAAMALLIRNETRKGKVKFEYPLDIQSAQVRIVNNTFKQFKVRIRLLDVVEVGGKLVPGKDILNESVVVESSIFDGWLKIDLSPYTIKVNSDYFLVFEWILEKKDRANLYQQYEKFKRENPSRVTIDYSYVNGEKIAYANYQGNFYFGTSFGISVAPSTINEHICYYRLNSFGQWYPSSSVLTASVIMSNQAVPGKQEIKSVADSLEVNELSSHYRISKLYHQPEMSTLENESINRKYLFSSRMDEPIDITVHRDQNRLTFFAKNQSHYPYRLSMHFSRILNLQPLIRTREYIIYPGSQKLLEFNIVDPTLDHYHYELTIEEKIGDTTITALSPNFPYLIPIGASTPFRVPPSGDSEVSENTDVFSLNAGDYVYAMRKGVVTCIPNSVRKIDRIMGQGSVEILHQDGTVMAYQNLDPASLSLKEGMIVFPGDVLGMVNHLKLVEVSLFDILPSEELKSLQIHYYLSDETPVSYSQIPDGMRAVYPKAIIEREKTEKERKILRSN